MEALKKFAIAISKTSVEPQMFGHVHLICLGIMLTLIVLLCVFAKNWQEKNVKKVMLAVWIIMILVEAYKQFIWPFIYGGSNNEYVWGIFPFQLCSTPLFVLPFYIFSKKEGVKHACASYLMTFSLFGGLVTMLYPPQVFIEIIGVNVQTMVHHGLQVVIGIFLACYYRKNLNYKFFLKGIFVYLILFAVALGLNFLVPLFTTQEFNMFYISKYYDCTLPLLGDIVYPNVPWIAFLFIYFLGFAFIAFLIFSIEKLCTIKARKTAGAIVYETTLVEAKPAKSSSKKDEKEKKADSRTPVIVAKSTSAKSTSKTASSKASGSKSGASKTSKSSSAKTSKSTPKTGAKTSTKKSEESNK